MFKKVHITEGHDNFFTPLRFFFAYIVLIGHAFVVIGGSSASEPKIFYNFTVSYIAVNLFFIASGFLVTASMLYRKSPKDYAASRFLRIYPGLIVHVFIMMLVFGPLTTSLPFGEYISHIDTLKQPFLVLPFIDTEMLLPSILANNAEHQASGALWTLRYEVMAYFGTLTAYKVGLLKHRWMLFSQFALFAIALPLTQYLGVYDDLAATFRSLLRFGMCYGLGAAIYGYRKEIKLHIIGIPICFGLAALTHNSVIFETMMTIALGYTLFWMAYVKLPALNDLRDISDISYGLYIYHWSVLQGIYMFMPDINPWQLIAIGTPISIVIASLSWRFVEKPALNFKAKIISRLHENLPKPS